MNTRGLFRFLAAAALAAVGMTPAIAQQSAIDAQLMGSTSLPAV